MDIVMPKMGESVNEGTIIKWHKKVGDSVKQDEIIFEISTDKVDTEIPSPADGILKEIKHNEGETVEVGTVVAVVDGEGDSEDKKENVSDLAENEIEAMESLQHKEEDSEKLVEEKVLESDEEEIEETTFSSGIVNIEMPKMGESVMEGTIIKWYKKIGDKISKDETIFEISTDKVDTEIPSPVDGIMEEILIGEQETVEVGTLVAKIATGEGVSTKPKKEKTQEKKVEIKESEQQHKTVQKSEKPEKEKLRGEGSSFFSPLVMSIAEKENISYDELRNIAGTGLQGRVTKKDVLSYLEDGKSRKPGTLQEEESKKEKISGAPAPSFAPSDAKTTAPSDGVEKIPMDNIRQKIMDHMVASRDTSVHVTSMIEIDMTRVHNFIKEKKDKYQQKEGVKLTYMAFLAQACVKAIKEYPLINSTIDGNTILKKKYVNLGIAVAIEPTGLIVPNIKGADQLNLIGLAKGINDLAQRSRNKKLTPDDISGGTFTLTNYGVFGTVFGTPIINQPEVAILGVGAVIKKPVVITVDGSDTIAVRHIMALTLSHDHRLIDGMLGGLFLKHIKDSLENFDPDTI